MEALLQLLAVTSLSEIRKMQTIYDNVEANLRGFEVLGIMPYGKVTYFSFLVPVIN